jgi:hypothetical protein
VRFGPRLANLAGTGSNVIGSLQTVLRRGARDLGPVPREAAAGGEPSVPAPPRSPSSRSARCSPQFLIWPYIVLVRGRRGRCPGRSGRDGLDQLWFPFRYWDYALQFDATASWFLVSCATP